jgi:hypothetical protein
MAAADEERFPVKLGQRKPPEAAPVGFVVIERAGVPSSRQLRIEQSMSPLISRGRPSDSARTSAQIPLLWA